MSHVFLSYARADGKPAATRLRGELERVGFQIWRDIEDMQGGQSWKDQLREALRTVQVVVVLLTPAAVASKYVEWEWETALTLDKRVIPLLLMPCDVPSDLSRLHYHNLSTDQEYTLGFAALIRDLYSLTAHVPGKPSGSDARTPSDEEGDRPSGGRAISIGGHVSGSNLVLGDGNTVGNNNVVQRVTQTGKYNVNLGTAQGLIIGDTIHDNEED
ncbi:MAG: TIR domain-containing protein [Oculatellaceae cyanobacterium bins.114]|nr:TIR domain-containing protein [Oculatellaceae cyanobacterium bins.114]